MKLYEMYTPFDTLSEEEQHKFIIAYREKRAEVIQKHIASSHSRKTKAKKPKLSIQEKALLKKLGITSLKSLKL